MTARVDLRGGEPPRERWDPAERRAIPYPRPADIGGHGALVLVHQTDCTWGTTAKQRAAAGGDRELARAQRMRATPYHYGALGVTGVAQAVALWPLEAYTYHANAGNRYAVGLGIEGRWPRAEAERLPRHMPAPGSPGAEAVAEAAREALRWAVEDLLAAGAGSVALVTHRQTNPARGPDPGEALLEALAPAAAALGVPALPGWVRGRGRPWPTAWRQAWLDGGATL